MFINNQSRKKSTSDLQIFKQFQSIPKLYFRHIVMLPNITSQQEILRPYIHLTSTDYRYKLMCQAGCNHTIVLFCTNKLIYVRHVATVPQTSIKYTSSYSVQHVRHVATIPQTSIQYTSSYGVQHVRHFATIPQTSKYKL